MRVKFVSRVYHRFEDCEEFSSPMYKPGSASDRDEIMKCLDFMRDTDQFSFYMFYVTNEWEKSCEQNFTNPNLNHVAWLGQAACAEGCGVSFDVVRSAWSMLETEKQSEANDSAKKAIEQWRKEYNV